MNQTRTVICMKWGTLYPATYVNVLYRAARANLTGPFRFVCLTDDSTGLDPKIETFAIPDMGLSDFDWMKGGWAKLSVFKKELYDIEGRCLFLDLDSVITGPLDDLFEYPGDVVVIDSSKNWLGQSGVTTPMAMTSIFAFTAGKNPEVFENFMADHAGMVAKYRIEQIFLQSELAGEMTFWPRDWIVSFKWHLRRSILSGFVLPPRPAPANCRLIAFHGEPRPIDLVRSGWWGVFPHMGRGRVQWMVDYWARFGGDVQND